MRKKIIRFLAYIYVFFIVLNRRLTVSVKKRMAEGVCALVMVFAMVVSALGQGAARPITEGRINAASVAHSHNKVINSDTAASIEINRSNVSRDELSEAERDKKDRASKGTKKNTVKKNNTAGSDGRNMVVKNPVPLSQIETMYANNGVRPENNGEELLYQYPVELGYAVGANYDGVQTALDYILRDIFETIPTEEEDEQDADEESTEESAKDDTASGDAKEAEAETVSGDAKEDAADGEQDKEEDNRIEQFYKNVWNVVLPTKPVEQSLSGDKLSAYTIVRTPSVVSKQETESEDDKASKSENEASASEDETTEAMDDARNERVDASGDGETARQADDKVPGNEEATEPTDDEASKVVEHKADSGYFTVRGKMRPGVHAFVGDITIEPTGINGFDKVRIGEDGEFSSSVVLTKEASDKKVTLYFSNGSEVTNGVDYIYSKDTVAPVLAFEEEGLNRLQGADKVIYCTNEPMLKVVPKDETEDTEGSGIDKICYVYGDKLMYVFDNFDDARITVADDFYGRILMNCSDKAGNTSEILSKYYLVEKNAPTVTIAEDPFCTMPYTLWIDVEDTGHIISGIQKIECTVNGEPYEIGELELLKRMTIDRDVEVPSKYEFSLPFTEEGDYNIVVTATDNAGNVTVKEQTITVTKPELVSVLMPKEFTIHIDPQQLAGREQIFSDGITLHNNSEMGVKVTVKNIELMVKDEISDTGIKKDCDMYLIAPDTGKKIALKKGSNEDIYSYCLPEGAEGDISTLTFVGNTSKGSDAMWRGSDISINVELSFEKWSEE